MKIAISSIIIICILIIGNHDSISGELTYACKVIHVYELDNEGFLRISNWEKQFKYSEFSVSRITGEIIGDVVPTLLAHSTKIINKGNKEYSFKSVAEFGEAGKSLSSGSEDKRSTTSVQLLEIQEFHHGESKPFVAISMGGAGIVTGLCK